MEERTGRQIKSMLNKGDGQDNLTGLERRDSMFSRRFPSAKSLLGKQALLMELFRCFSFVVGAGQIFVAVAIATSSGFSAPAICQSTSFDLLLLLFVLGPFPIQSVASLEWRLELLGGGSGGGCGVAGVGGGVY